MITPTTSVSVTQLTVVRELGVGGQGVVTLVQAPGLSSEPLAFKKYSPSTVADIDVDTLERFVALPAQAGAELASLLRRSTAWPVATVLRDDAVCGFLMPPAPEDFLSYLRLPTGYRAQLLAMEFLLNPPEYMASVDLPVTERSRLALLCVLAELLRDLHRHGVVVGDLSPKNVLISLRSPRCYLLDCDAMRVAGRSVLPQIETPDWRLPDGEELATEASDRFKYGLLVIRLLQSDQSANDPELLRQTQPRLADLAVRSRTDPEARPSWDEWISALNAALPLASSTVPTSPAPDPAPRPVPAPPVAAPGTATRPTPATPTGTPPGTAPRTRRNTLAALAVAGVLIVLVGLLTGRCDGADDRGAASNPPAGGVYGGQNPAPAETGEPSWVGMVELAGAGGGQDALAVAEFFDAYFSGINDRDWQSVLALYDPAGVVDSTDREQRASFTSAMQTTVDSEVKLLEVRTQGSRVLARVTFRSEQDAGYGPKDDPDLTCARWDITFALTRHGGGYRILQPDDYSYRPC